MTSRAGRIGFLGVARRLADYVPAALAIVACLAVQLPAAPATNEPSLPDVDTSIAKGLTFLAKQQNPDGSFEGGGPKVAITALSVLAFLSAGQTPDVGRHGLALRAAIDFLLSQQAADGYFGAGDRGMYAHAIATLALAEAYGVESSPKYRARMHDVLVKAVQVILDAQNVAKSNPSFVGGWRYERNSADSDLSLSGWNTLAIRACQDGGIRVPDEAPRKAVEFVLRCYNEGEKAFGYQPGQGPQSGDSAIAVLCLYLLGASESAAAQLEGGVKFIESHPIDDAVAFPYYASYYVSQAAFQRGGATWSKAGRATLERMAALQDKDGGWPQSKSGQEPGRVYATAMAVQALAVPYRLLPVYQR